MGADPARRRKWNRVGVEMEGVPMRLVLAVLGLGGCFTTEDAQDYWDESNCDYEPLDAEDCLDQIRLYGITCNEGDGNAIAKECDDVYDCE